MTERVVILADHSAAFQHFLNVDSCDLVAGPRPDVVGTYQIEGAAALLVRPVESPENLLRGFLSGVDYVFGGFESFIEGGVVEQVVFLFKNRKNGLPGCGGPASEYCGNLVLDDEFLRFFGERRPVGSAVFLYNLDLPSQDAAGFVDLVDGETFRFHGSGFADRHCA